MLKGKPWPDASVTHWPTEHVPPATLVEHPTTTGPKTSNTHVLRGCMRPSLSRTLPRIEHESYAGLKTSSTPNKLGRETRSQPAAELALCTAPSSNSGRRYRAGGLILPAFAAEHVDHEHLPDDTQVTAGGRISLERSRMFGAIPSRERIGNAKGMLGPVEVPGFRSPLLLRLHQLIDLAAPAVAHRKDAISRKCRRSCGVNIDLANGSWASNARGNRRPGRAVRS